MRLGAPHANMFWSTLVAYVHHVAQGSSIDSRGKKKGGGGGGGTKRRRKKKARVMISVRVECPAYKV